MDTETQYKETGKINSQVIQEILKVEKEEGLTAESLLEKAKEKDSPLHDLFDWNNTEAGEKWRLHQARILINEVKVIINQKEFYAFENVKVIINSDESETKREYKPVIEIFNNEDYRKQVINTALASVSYWKEKYSEYNELKPIFVSIEKVKKKWQKKKR